MRLRKEAIRRGLIPNPDPNPYAIYRDDPCGYARDVLRVQWWKKQEEMANALLSNKKVAVAASHGVGKSHGCAGLINWYFDAYDPGIVLSTANSKPQVEDVLWKQVRAQRPGKSFLQPRAPRMESSETHFAVGYTAANSTSFQGRHEERLLIIFDEADGIDGQFFDAAEGMLTYPTNRWLCIYNPTESSSRMKEEEDGGDWHRLTISALEHPNVLAQLSGLPIPFPGAVSLEWVEERLRKWTKPVLLGHKATDVEWPPGSGIWYRPGPMFESRVLGRRPRLGIDTVWSDAAWEACQPAQEIPDKPVKIGCDVARFGDDDTVIMIRRGPCALHLEAHNGIGTNETAGRLQELCREYASLSGQEPQTVECFIDDDGIGGGAVDQAGGYTFIPVSGASRANDPELYPNRRSEVWFSGVEDRAEEGLVDLSRLSDEDRRNLRRELQSVKYKMMSGRRTVEPKEETKKRLKRSPDHADAFNLCYCGEDERRLVFY